MVQAYLLRRKGDNEILAIVFKDSLNKAMSVIDDELTTLELFEMSTDIKKLLSYK